MNFDEPIDRRGSRSSQWDKAKAETGVDGDDFIAMWTADTDFRMAEPIARALRKLADDGFASYLSDIDDFREAVVWWMGERHDWFIDPSWILPVNGLGNGISMTVQALTEPGDEVVIFTPVYHEFRLKIRGAGRIPLEVRMQNRDGRAVPDLEAAAKALTDRSRAVLFCSPHNPGGQVWSRVELEAVAAFCRENDLLLLSDEIHHDLVYPGHRFLPFAAIEGIKDRLVTLAAPSKTFNIAGLRTGQLIIENDALRTRVREFLQANQIQPNVAGIRAAAAAYTSEGAAWADAQNAYLLDNRNRFAAGMEEIPGVRATRLDSTFLAWIDFNGTGMTERELSERIMGRARIAAAHGTKFGPGGDGFFRFAIGTQRSRLDEAISRPQAAFSDLQ